MGNANGPGFDNRTADQDILEPLQNGHAASNSQVSSAMSGADKCHRRWFLGTWRQTSAGRRTGAIDAIQPWHGTESLCRTGPDGIGGAALGRRKLRSAHGQTAGHAVAFSLQAGRRFGNSAGLPASPESKPPFGKRRLEY